MEPSELLRHLVDRAYIDDWASRLGLESVWDAVLERRE